MCEDRDITVLWNQAVNTDREVTTNRPDIIQTSAEESLGLHELKQNKPWFDEDCLGFWIKGSGLKYSGERIQDKAM